MSNTTPIHPCKRCPSCRITKLTTDFHVRRASRDGLTSRCKACLKIINAEQRYWRRKHREREGQVVRKPTGEETWQRRITGDAVKSAIATFLFPLVKNAPKTLEMSEELQKRLAGLTF